MDTSDLLSYIFALNLYDEILIRYGLKSINTVWILFCVIVQPLLLLAYDFIRKKKRPSRELVNIGTVVFISVAVSVFALLPRPVDNERIAYFEGVQERARQNADRLTAGEYLIVEKCAFDLRYEALSKPVWQCFREVMENPQAAAEEVNAKKERIGTEGNIQRGDGNRQEQH